MTVISAQNAPKTVCWLGSARTCWCGVHCTHPTPSWIGEGPREVCRRRSKQEEGNIWERRGVNRRGTREGMIGERRAQKGNKTYKRHTCSLRPLVRNPGSVLLSILSKHTPPCCMASFVWCVGVGQNRRSKYTSNGRYTVTFPYFLQ